jgi:hypothetical protein
MAEQTGRSKVAAAILKALKDPFDPRLVKYRKGGGGSLAYIDARDVMKRLDEVMGAENWKDSYSAVDGGFICELSLRIEGEWITKSNGANNTKVEPIKGGISSALKRAAVEWGVGRYMYYFDVNKYKWSEHNVKKDWPAIFLPGAPEDWEKVAEEQYGETVGMDEEEIASAAIEAADSVDNAQTVEELRGIVEKMDARTQRLLVDKIANKTDELTRGE